MSDAGASPSPSLPAPVEAALGRLSLAVERLRSTAARAQPPSHHVGSAEPDRDAERAVMVEDRARLAAQLDLALARVARLGDAQAAALARLNRAETTVTAALRDLEDDRDEEEDGEANGAEAVTAQGAT